MSGSVVRPGTAARGKAPHHHRQDQPQNRQQGRQQEQPRKRSWKDRARPGAAAGRTAFPHCFHAEWIKIRTMRSTFHLVLGTLVFCTGLALLSGTSAGSEYATLSAADRAAFDPLATGLRGYLLAQVALGLLGGLTITSEYGARTIVGTLTAVPHRVRVLAAKAVVLVLVALPTGLLVSLTGFVAGQAMLIREGAPYLALSDPQALRGIVGCGLYLTLAALFGLALGTMIRSTTATVTTLFGVLLIVQAFAPALPGGVGDWMVKYWPPLAGGQIITSYRDPALLGPWAGLAVMAGCVAALLTAAFVVFHKRDA
ncbi:ABC transporter permease [Streptomyces thermogriseus]|uniref:ABC transporter permease subunit n=1 Tax=Streptomyces thermogriseus TaxID=75292 RepID=A0ABN1SU95_9ACTN